MSAADQYFHCHPMAGEHERSARLEQAITRIVDANLSFRASMPENWEGDPLQSAIDEAARLVGRGK